MQPVLESARANLKEEVVAIGQLSEVASKYPYYKFNYAWSRQMQDAVCFSVSSPRSTMAS